MNTTINTYCRLCAQCKPNNKMVNLQTNQDKRHEIVAKLIRVNGINEDIFDQDILPKTVCFVCVNTLQKSFDFVQSIEQAQAVLNDIILMKEIKKEVMVDKHSESDNDDSVIYQPLDPKPVKQEDRSDDSDTQKINSYLKRRAEKLAAERQKKRMNRRKNPRCVDGIPLSQLKLTWKDYLWTCSFCDTQFSTVSELKSHSMQYHNACNAYRCGECNMRKLRLDSFLLHVKRHKKHLKFSCYICFTRFSTTNQTNIHKTTHIDSDHICSGCNSTFPTAEELAQHMLIFKKDKKTRGIPIIEALGDDLTCLICKKTFKSRGNLNTHLLTHTDRKRDHTCDKCGKCFFNKQSLAGHMLLHDEARPFQCVICKFGFKTKGRLRNHIGVHGGEKPFSCDQCGRCFRLQKQLTSHSIIHTDSLPYVCTYCNKSFRFKTILNQHIRQHTGVKPYSCTICQRDFTNWPNYNKHMKRLHGMDMAKKKHTPEGVFPINPATGELVIYPEAVNTEEWKKQLMTTRRGPGRPKMDFAVKEDDKQQTLMHQSMPLQPTSNPYSIPSIMDSLAPPH